MDMIQISALLLLLLTVFLAGGVWIAISLMACGWVAMQFVGGGIPAGSVLATTIWGNSASWTLAALPLFIWMGEILYRTKLSEEMFRGLAPWLNWLPGRLMHVNVLWSSSEQPSNDERAKISAAGLQLTQYFRQQAWKPDAATTAVPSGPNALVLFAGIDPKNAMVEVRLSGVAIAGASAPPPSGPARLRVAYAATIGKQDVAAPVKPGSF